MTTPPTTEEISWFCTCAPSAGAVASFGSFEGLRSSKPPSMEGEMSVTPTHRQCAMACLLFCNRKSCIFVGPALGLHHPTSAIWWSSELGSCGWIDHMKGLFSEESPPQPFTALGRPRLILQLLLGWCRQNMKHGFWHPPSGLLCPPSWSHLQDLNLNSRHMLNRSDPEEDVQWRWPHLSSWENTFCNFWDDRIVPSIKLIN